MRSETASDRQPVLPQGKRLYQVQEFENGRALSTTIHIREYARFWAEDARVSGWYETDWRTTRGTQYHQATVRNADDAIDAMQSYVFPHELRAQARRGAGMLTDVFDGITHRHVERNLTSGPRLDRRKYGKLAMGCAAGHVDVDAIRPYRRTTWQETQPPTIGIVAAAGNTDMWRSEKYIANVLVIALTIQWAAEAAGLNAFAALTQGNWARFKDYAYAVYGTIVAETDKPLSPNVYGVALHRDLWRHGKMTAHLADYEWLKLMARQQGMRINRSLYGAGFRSGDGGRAVTWAHEVHGADVVIAIGNILDKHQADVHLSADVEPHEAVAAVRRHLTKRA